MRLPDLIVGGSAFRCDNCGTKLTDLDLQGRIAHTKDGEKVVSMARTPTGGIMLPHTCEHCAVEQGLDTRSSTLDDRTKMKQRGEVNHEEESGEGKVRKVIDKTYAKI